MAAPCEQNSCTSCSVYRKWHHKGVQEVSPRVLSPREKCKRSRFFRGCNFSWTTTATPNLWSEPKKVLWSDFNLVHVSSFVRLIFVWFHNLIQSLRVIHVWPKFSLPIRRLRGFWTMSRERNSSATVLPHKIQIEPKFVHDTFVHEIFILSIALRIIL